MQNTTMAVESQETFGKLAENVDAMLAELLATLKQQDEFRAMESYSHLNENPVDVTLQANLELLRFANAELRDECTELRKKMATLSQVIRDYQTMVAN